VKGFKFKLQSILDARIKVLENCQLAMAKVQNKLNKAVKHLEYLYETLNKNKNDLEKLINTGNKIDCTEVNNYKNYIDKLKIDIKNQHKVIADLEIEMEEKKQAVLEALKAKTMLEKLYEKALKEFKENIEKLDFREIDEIATNRQRRIASKI
jgi:flagellar protein FliJ